MPRPKSKDELLTESQGNFEKLLALVHSYPKEALKKEFSQGTMNRNIRDVLAHLHHWHKMMLSWYDIGMKGKKPDMPAKGYTWKTLPFLNMKIRETYQDVTLENVQKMILDSHQQVHYIIKKHSNEELFQKKKYPWTGSTSLGAYLISNTSSHYDWAHKVIKRGMKS